MLQQSVKKLDPREEHYWIASPHAGLQMFLRRLPPARPPAGPPQPVVYVHGATFRRRCPSRIALMAIRGAMPSARKDSTSGRSIFSGTAVPTAIRR